MNRLSELIDSKSRLADFRNLLIRKVNEQTFGTYRFEKSMNRLSELIDSKSRLADFRNPSIRKVELLDMKSLEERKDHIRKRRNEE
jgi:hypothetical protein